MRITSFTWVLDVESLGVGIVERSIVLNIAILSQDNAYRLQKTTMVLFVVRKSQDLSKKTIVQEAIPVTVQNAGKPKKFMQSIYQTGETSVGSLPDFVPVLSYCTFLSGCSSFSFVAVSADSFHITRWVL